MTTACDKLPSDISSTRSQTVGEQCHLTRLKSRYRIVGPLLPTFARCNLVSNNSNPQLRGQPPRHPQHQHPEDILDEHVIQSSGSRRNCRRNSLIVGMVALGIFLILMMYWQSRGISPGVSLWLSLSGPGISVGSLALLMLQHLTGGGWGFVIRRVLEASTRMLPLMAVLFVPILVGAHYLYPWTHHEEVSKARAIKTPVFESAVLHVPSSRYFRASGLHSRSC